MFALQRHNDFFELAMDLENYFRAGIVFNVSRRTHRKVPISLRILREMKKTTYA